MSENFRCFAFSVECIRINVMRRSYNGPYRNSPEHKGSSQRNCSRGPPCSPGLDFEDDSHSRYVSDMGRNKTMMDNAEDSEVRIHFYVTILISKTSNIFFFFFKITDDQSGISSTS